MPTTGTTMSQNRSPSPFVPGAALPPVPAPARANPPAAGPSATKPTRVALLLDAAGSYRRGLLQGIAKFSREHGGWSICAQLNGAAADAPPAWLEAWDGDGVIARVASAETTDATARCRAPVVNLRGSVPAAHLPSVTVDNVQVAKLAAQHLRERGLREFAFCGRLPGTSPALDQRGDNFRLLVERGGQACHVFPADRLPSDPSWEQEQEFLTAWVESLPKPIGIMACDDARGLQVLDACRRCGATVPDDVAVIGVDNDEALCQLATPPLSSVDVNAEGMGYEAAALLERLMAGRKAPARPVRVPPRGVVARASTDLAASEDEDVSRAVQFIRDHACTGLQVVDVLAHLRMSRASLQQRMKQSTGRTVHQEIQRVRLDRVKDLLVSSPKTIKQVARESGFSSVQYMTRVFRAVTGETPACYRRRRGA
jgi:LacI family transcriptional regulator